ncbi:hypothetical protein [Mycobacterium sp. URHB0021]
MPQPKFRRTEADLRQWLLRERKAFRQKMASRLADDADWSSSVWDQLSCSVDALANGGEYRLHAWQLPDGHWALVHGVTTDWVLGADDVLRVV